MNDSTDTILFNVNGRDIEVKNPDPETMGLTGTKIGCEEGACGSCTVVIGKWNEDKKKAHYSAVNACLYPLFLADNCLVLTVEGIGNPQKMHPIQERLAKGHGTQCGFCSPGFIMSAYALFRNNPSPTKFDVDMAIKGNYCRCTGYRPIIEAFYSFTNGGCCQGKNGNKCPCKAALGGTNGFQNNTTNGAEKSHPDGRLVSLNDLPNIDPTQEFIFPPSLLLRPPAKSLHLIGDRVELFSPVKEDQLWTLPISENTRVISSGMITRLVAVTKPKMKETWHSIHRIPEYSSFSLTDDAIIVGSSLSVAKMMQLVEVYAQNGEIFTLKMDDFIVSYFNLKSKMYIKSVKIPRKLAGKMFTLKHGARIGGDEPIVNFAAILKESDKIDEARVTFGLHERPFLAKNISEFLVGK
ncbi:hypothetical protein WR25_15165 [Diploscapter pachys]|uniref:2Fe-2S ferredoxin-type domain-containing protein n=1 Tax=Diploscapter pachys TaxID=2018661 RepID=A0A2A2KP58_9BILA|nr:hypothetical protein WR25_15165 [Diploscapter pachys]